MFFGLICWCRFEIAEAPFLQVQQATDYTFERTGGVGGVVLDLSLIHISRGLRYARPRLRSHTWTVATLPLPTTTLP